MIKEIRLYEGGPQLWGANPNTPTLGLTKSYIQENKDELKAYFDNLVSAVRNGNFTDKILDFVSSFLMMNSLYHDTVNLSRATILTF